MSGAAPRWYGGRVSPAIQGLVAPNPGPMTLDGTNTWLIGDPSRAEVLVIDPGPDDEAHVAAVLSALEERSARVLGLALTHRHDDHRGAVPALSAALGVPLLTADELTRRERWAGVRLEVMKTPGHTSDSTCFVLPEESALLTGDTVLGRGSAVIAHPDGVLGDYLRSLERLRARAVVLETQANRAGAATSPVRILPGHGPVLLDATAALTGYLQHRLARLDEVRAALERSASTPEEVVALVYPDLEGTLRLAATATVAAALTYLSAH